MAETVIHARDLRKIYRLYNGPGARFLDMFGLLRNRPGAFTEHAALDGVSLDIARGEKVAFIGRNGAGKSTLLKLVTKVIEPTSGTLEVRGKIHALLQIGTGFHPDFTGRQNVYAYLAQLGVTGREADRRYTEIVEFAELEEYIAQPVKTYSTGMAVRLMFSTATAITPELLVLDEVLGVGDAYFAQKSYERMRELTEGAGTTLLLVTHDVYSAVKICDRLVWIDRGRVLMDGDGPTVIKAYEDSIRHQEESRLRFKKQARLKELAAELQVAGEPLLLEIKPADGRPQASVVHFSRIAVQDGDRVIATLPLDDGAFDESLPSHLQKDGSSWGPPSEWEGRPGRPLQNFGSAFHKAAGVLAIDRAASAGTSVVIDYWSESEVDLVVEAFWGRESAVIGHLAGPPRSWNSARCDLSGSTTQSAALSVKTSGLQGSGALVIHTVRTLDGNGEETLSLRHGEPATLELDYEIKDPAFHESPQVVVAVHRDGVQDVCRWIARDLHLDGRQPRGKVRLRIPAVLLTDGQYSITILVAKEGYYDQPQTMFFSLNPDVYYCASRLFDIVVRGSGLIGSGTITVADGDWEVSA